MKQIKMSYKRRHLREISSDSDLQSSISSQDLQQSQPTSSQSDEEYDKRLSKKDLEKLIKLEKKIQEQKRLLRKLKNKKAVKKSPLKKQLKKEQPPQLEVRNEKKNYTFLPQTTQSKKLFITGIEYKYSHEEVSNELKYIFANLEGVTGFRIKRKQGCPTYVFLDFQDKKFAKQGIEILRKTKIFGVKLPIYYSQDEKKQKQPSKGQFNEQYRKKCYECNQFGHIAKDCWLRKKLQYDQEDKKTQCKKEDRPSPIKPSSNIKLEYIQPAIQQPLQQDKQVIQRVVREKSRLSKLVNLNS